MDTANKVSDKLGTYTTQAYGESSNSNIKHDNSSSSMSLISRKLLTGDEVLRIESPYVLVMIAGKRPAIAYVPDISKTHFNKLCGMGNPEHNQKLRIKRENSRAIRKMDKIKIWDIWNQYLEKQEENIDLDEEFFKNFSNVGRKKGKIDYDNRRKQEDEEDS